MNDSGTPTSNGKPAPRPGSARSSGTVDSPLSKLVRDIFTLFGAGPKTAPRAAAEAVSAVPAVESEDVPSEDAGGPLGAVVIRNRFYRDGFRNMLRIAIAEAVIIVVLVLGFIAYMNAAQPRNYYFATTADGRIMQLVPLNFPNMEVASLMSWAAQAASEVMTFGFHDYQRRMQQSSRHFTRRGWESFTEALQKSRIIQSVEGGQQVVTAQPRSAPVLVQEGVFNGRYRWVIDLPLAVDYQGKGGTRTDSMAVRLVIDRVSSLENPNGVGIEQWIATQ